ncbi:acyltransferase family protein [Heyndrickxia camelliae]|uniref:Acetyltransferase n=1 Tax=Heyndrickxia camelliae TaxID=1707093 RepID=A0A2N3LI05_9BACI|nr:acyltransferase family protein [Heyndrickxia camelliae]PKR84217.1 acetyltransferase [Heyndrickxia camelliae]
MELHTEKKRYIHSLDGLRALAVFAVIFYHLGFGWASGGFLGVCVFFVLSGYLITDLLVSEKERKGTIDLKSFWYRRARRLLPAMFTLLIALSCWVILFDRHFLASLRGDIIAASFYFSNWWYIFHHVSYFESFHSPSLLTHFWSLAVEEQFYLVWPLLILIGLNFLSKRSVLFLTLLAAILSGLAMAFLYQPGMDPSRVYYGTDTRAFSLLIGAALALCWPSQKLAGKVPFKSSVFLNFIGAFGLFILLWMLARTNQYESFLYLGGMILLSVITVLLLASLVHPASSISRIFELKPLRFLGVRSYGIYLWHYPIILLTTPAVHTQGISIFRVLFQIALIILLSSLSYTFIENPIRKNGFGVIWKRLGIFSYRRAFAFVGVSVILLISILFSSNEPSAKTNSKTASLSVPTEKQTSMKGEKQKEKPNEERKESPTSQQDSVSKEVKVQPSKKVVEQKVPLKDHNSAGEHKVTQKANNSTIAKNKHSTKNSPPPNSNLAISAIGDSILVDVEPHLKKIYPSIKVNAVIGRQMYQALDVVKQMKKNGELGNVVIIELGTNGPFTKSQLETMMNIIGVNRKVIFVNTRVPRPWQNIVNTALKEAAAKYSNASLVDWYSSSTNHNEYFEPDGVHLNPKGASTYASLVANKVK